MKELHQLFSDELAQILDLEYASALSTQFDKLEMQESFRFRALFYSKKVAHFLLDEKGEFHLDNCLYLTKLVQKNPDIHFPYPEDSEFLEHILSQLLFLLQEKKARDFIGKYKRTSLSKSKKSWISYSLLDSGNSITDRMVRLCLLSALFVPVQQNIGSCFATAPARYIQKKMPFALMEDLYDLLYKGKIEKIFNGNQYSVPVNPSWGESELKRVASVEKISNNPAFLLACEGIQIIPAEKSVLEKSEILQSQLASYKKASSPKNLLHKLLLDRHKLTEEELAKEKEIQKKQEQAFAKLGFYGHYTPTKREKYEKDMTIACSLYEAMTAHPLLKIWEFTLASFSDSKQIFTRWNLYKSLGIDPKEKDPAALTPFIHKLLEEKAEKAQKEAKKIEEEYLIAFDKTKSAQSLVLRATTEAQLSQYNAELKAAFFSLKSLEDMKEKAIKKAEGYAQLPSIMLQKFLELFPNFFQELYDPNMQEVDSDIYSDSPAGFRLYYKHGRKDPTLWSFIEDENSFSSALQDFFINAEKELNLPFLKEEIEELITEIIHHVQSKEFLTFACKEKRPWSYISGGTMDILLHIYFKREEPFTTISVSPKSSDDLIKLCQQMTEHTEDRYFITSPTHAFLFRNDLWKRQYIRSIDKQVEKAKTFYADIFLDEKKQEYLLDKLFEKLPLLPKEVSLVQRGTTADLFRNHLLALYAKEEKAKKIIDGLLFSHLPLTHYSELEETSYAETQTFFSPKEILSLLGLNKSWKEKSLFSQGSALAKQIKKSKFFYPYASIFAETNWPTTYFAWLCGPGEDHLSLWVVDYWGISGFPMYEWENMMDKEEKNKWIIYCDQNQFNI